MSVIDVALAMVLGFIQAEGSARDAYLEGWFLESAESDLAGALRAYEQCVARATAADPELAAKALWRMGRIARARGDEQAARGFFERVVSEFGATVAAEQARADLAASTAASTEPKEDAAVEDARRMLRELLLSDEPSGEKTRAVFRTLSVGEVLRIHEEVGGNLLNLLNQLPGRDFAEAIEEIAVRCGPVLRERALMALLDVKEYRAPTEVVALAREIRGKGAEYLAWILADQRDPAALQAVAGMFAKGGPLDKTDLQRDPLLRRVEQSPEPAAALVFDAIVALLERHGVPAVEYSQWVRPTILTAASPYALHARRRIPALPARFRLTLATVATDSDASVPEDAIEVFLADPEPAVRRAFIHALLASSHAGERRRALERFVAEGPPWDVQPLQKAILDTGEDPVVWLDATSGALREFVYWWVLVNHAPMQAVGPGLERGDPEFIAALCGPTEVPNNPDIVAGGASFRECDPALTRNENALLAGLEAHPDATLLRRLADAVAARDEEDMRREFVAFLQRSGRADVAERFARDPSPAIRLLVATLSIEGFAPDTQRALLVDENDSVARSAIERCTDAALLLEVLSDTPTQRLQALTSRAVQLEDRPLLRAILARTDPGTDAWWSCFHVLAWEDVDLLLKTLEDPTLLPEAAPVVRKACPELKVITADSAREHRDDIEKGLRTRRINQVVDVSSGGLPDAAVLHRGRQLAQIASVDEMKELLEPESSSLVTIRIAAYGLAASGEREFLRERLLAATSVDHLVGPALAAGLTDEVFALVRASRALPGPVVEALLALDDRARMAAFLYPDGHDHVEHAAVKDDAFYERAVSWLVEQGDTAKLLRAALIDERADAVRGLLRLGAEDLLFDAMRRQRRESILTALREMTGLPAESRVSPSGQVRIEWPTLRADQEALIAAWKDALAKSSR